MSVRIGCFAAVVFLFIVFINCSIIQAEDGYQECRYDYSSPLQITEPQLLKIEAPPTQVYESCEILFAAPEGKYVELEFKELDLGNLEMDYKHMNSCRKLPMVHLNDGGYWSMTSIGHPLCGKTNDLTTEQRIRRSNTRLVRLHYPNNGGRFQVQVNFVDSPGQTVCPSSVMELSGSGTLKFPTNDEVIYVNNQPCRWKITVAQGKRVKLTNKKNDLGGYDKYYPYTTCRGFGLSVYDNPTFTHPPVQEFCYGKVGQNVTEMTSSGNAFTLYFHGYEAYFNTGFEMDYEEI